MKALLALAVVGMVALSAPAARAETRRLAVLVGNNAGSGARPALRFAEDDAGKMAAVLRELGGFRRDDVVLLQGRSRQRVMEALAEVNGKLARFRVDPATKVVLLFYFSGHSDGQALELGEERLEFGELRRWLSGTGAAVRLAIVDSCKSGALLAQKGGTRGPRFDIRLTDEVASTGEALLTSAASDELALESKEIRGSFFSHHLISGLRGAADSSGDGRITLAEAYRYAFMHTLAATANTLAGPQHPEYDYRLSGRGEVVLTEVGRSLSRLTLPAGFDRILVQELARGQVVAEVGPGLARRIAVAPGRYRLAAFAGGRAFSATVETGAAERVVAREELQELPVALALAKGEASPEVAVTAGNEPAGAAATGGGRFLHVGAGAGRGVAERASLANALKLGLRPGGSSGWAVTLGLASGTALDLRESAAFFSGGYLLGGATGRWRGYLGVELGGGAVLQTVTRGPTLWTPGFLAVAEAGGAFALTRTLSLWCEMAAPLAVLRRDDALGASLLPVAVAGVAWALP